MHGKTLSIAEDASHPSGHSPDADGARAEKIYDGILDMIVDGDLLPGQRLSEPWLAKHFGVSRGPVREAIRGLEQRDFVRRSPNAGARIVQHTPKEILDAYDIRAVLEGLAAALAARNMTEDELVTLKELALDRSNFDNESYQGDFHMAIVRGSHNERLTRLIDVDYFRQFKIWRRHNDWLRFGGQNSWEEHRRILDAILARDSETAELLTRRHITRLRIESERRLGALGEGQLRVRQKTGAEE